MPLKLSPADISNIDKQIETLLECKPLSEAEVKALCEKVNLIKKFSLGFSQKKYENTFQYPPPPPSLKVFMLRK